MTSKVVTLFVNAQQRSRVCLTVNPRAAMHIVSYYIACNWRTSVICRFHFGTSEKGSSGSIFSFCTAHHHIHVMFSTVFSEKLLVLLAAVFSATYLYHSNNTITVYPLSCLNIIGTSSATTCYTHIQFLPKIKEF